MADVRLPILSADQRRIAAERFERARQVITTGSIDYGLQLLLTCCRVDPGNLIHRQELRRAQKSLQRAADRLIVVENIDSSSRGHRHVVRKG